MKKRLLTIAAIGVAVCCLGACKPADAGTAADEYDDLNAMLLADYSQIVLTVTNTFDEDTSLKSEYTITYSETRITVEYSVEKFNEIDLGNPSTQLKTTLTGTVFIVNGLVVSANETDVSISASIAQVGFTFKKNYFDNDVLSDGSFQADVKNVDSFIGSHINCSNMKIVATFDEVFSGITVTYISEGGNKVEIDYNFYI